MTLTCTHCNKRLSRKTARQIDGVVMCSACMFGRPFVGMEFTHRKWLDEHHKPLRCRVTRIVKDTVYWRSDDDGGPMHFPLGDFDKFAIRDSGSGRHGGDCSRAPGEAPQSGLPQEGIAQPLSQPFQAHPKDPS